jgi:hypothetical protein
VAKIIAAVLWCCGAGGASGGGTTSRPGKWTEEGGAWTIGGRKGDGERKGGDGGGRRGAPLARARTDSGHENGSANISRLGRAGRVWGEAEAGSEARDCAWAGDWSQWERSIIFCRVSAQCLGGESRVNLTSFMLFQIIVYVFRPTCFPVCFFTLLHAMTWLRIARARFQRILAFHFCTITTMFRNHKFLDL